MRNEGLASCVVCLRLVSWGGTGIFGPKGIVFPFRSNKGADRLFRITGIRQYPETPKPGAILHYCDFPLPNDHVGHRGMEARG